MNQDFAIERALIEAIMGPSNGYYTDLFAINIWDNGKDIIVAGGYLSTNSSHTDMREPGILPLSGYGWVIYGPAPRSKWSWPPISFAELLARLEGLENP